MKFPPISTTPPVLQDWQYSFDGLMFGGLQPWAVQEAKGLDLPKVRSSDGERPRADGEFEGLDYLSGRDITLTFHTQGPDSIQLRNALLALEAVMLPPADGVTETPLWFKRPGIEQLCCLVRPRQFGLAGNSKLAYAHIAQPVALLHASGSYVYGNTQSGIAGVPMPASGFGFPLHFPLDFGGGVSAGVITATNNGTKACKPVIIFTGPMLNPSIANASIAGNPSLTFAIELFASDELVVDMDLDTPTALYFVAGSDEGTSRLNTLTSGSSPWDIQPGVNVLTFATADGSPTGGTAEVQWADAYAVAV